MKKDKEIKIETIVVLAKLNNGKIYNVVMKKETKEVVQHTINLCEGGIKLLDTPIETIDIITKNK